MLVSIGIIVHFIVLQVPKLDTYLAEKYGGEFSGYAARTRKLTP